ncbi:protein argonaute 12-like [Panicum miliaceum]|uniref:Protein argonaute 12-like n=1 Tax=Panicum miliaceum TaxID=4540 RepID=A0A3L6SGD5_PANMI|nr:protein argonaute 12-like [Panicum miliaceum]
MTSLVINAGSEHGRRSCYSKEQNMPSVAIRAPPSANDDLIDRLIGRRGGLRSGLRHVVARRWRRPARRPERPGRRPWRPGAGQGAAVRAPRTSVPTLPASREEGVAAVAIAAVPRRQAPPREGATSSPHIRRPGPGEVPTLAWLIRGAGSRFQRRRRRLRRLRRQVERKAVVTQVPAAGPLEGPSSAPAQRQAPSPVLSPAAAARPQMQAKAPGQAAPPATAGSSSSVPARVPAPGQAPAAAARLETQGKSPAQATKMALAAPAGRLPPASSKALVLAPRPGYGTAGRRCRVRANHVQVRPTDKEIYHYDVAITPESISRARNRWIINELVNLHKEYLGGRLPVYDGKKGLFTAGPLPFKAKEFVLILTNPERANLGLESCREKEYKVVIKDASEIHMYSLQQFLADISAAAFYKAQPIIDFAVEYLNVRDTSKRLSDQERIKLKKALKGVRVETTHRRDISIRYKITGLTSAALNDLTFDQDGTRVSVVQYFRRQYNYSLKYTHWPCLQAGNASRPTYLPMEVCNIAKGQRYSSKLNERQVRNILRLACERPAEREERTLGVLKKNNYTADDYAKEFGIKVSNQLALVDACVLPAPKLKYHESGKEKVCSPFVGQWNMINKRISTQPCVQIKKARQDNVEAAIKDIYGHSAEVLAQQGLIKRLCETEVGVITQCCAPKNVKKGGKQFLENLALKINAKVVASMDWPQVTKYKCLVSSQGHRVEIINDLFTEVRDSVKGIVRGGMIRYLLISFKKSTGHKPKRIIFYRDGVSEGQFSQVLLYEMDAIRKACASLEEGYLPPVTFVVVQKRHRTRLFPENHRSKDQTDRSGNILPVPPAYYAHLGAFRARYYMEEDNSDQGSSTGTSRTYDQSVPVKQLPKIKENVQQFMFYC